MQNPDLLTPRPAKAVSLKDEPTRMVPARRRPGDNQREQKEETRRKLLDAAQVVFERGPYHETAVEMLAEQAGVSRTTFYRHFDGKLAVALSLFEEIAPRLKERWKELFGFREPTADDVRAWLERLVEASSVDRVIVSLFWQIEAIEPYVQDNKYKYYADVLGFMDLPGRGIALPRLHQLQAKFFLLMLQVDQFLYLVCARAWPTNRADLMRAMAAIIHAFLLEVRSADPFDEESP